MLFRSTTLTTATVQRTDQVDTGITGGISVFAADPGLADTLHASLASGKFLDAATAQYPAVVLGATAAQKLGVTNVADGLRVHINGYWFDVIGVLNPVAAAPGVDRAAVIGLPAAETYINQATISPDQLYVRKIGRAHV